MKLLTNMACSLALAAAATCTLAAEPVKIAFVDTGNTGRSVTAEAIATQFIAKQKLHVAVISRAVDMDPYDTAPEKNAATLLRQHGMDVSAHRAAQITANDVRHSDVLLTLTEKHRNKVIEQFPDAQSKTFVLGEYATGKPEDVPDAWGKPMPVYESMYAQVSRFVPLAVNRAVNEHAAKK